MTTKTCTKCGQSKPLEAFFRRRSAPRSECKVCTAAANRAWRERNPERRREIDRAAYVANREQHLARDRAWRKENTEKRREIQRAYYEGNREKIAEWDRAYRYANPHIDWVKGYRRRALKYGHLPIVEDFTKDDVVERYGAACVHCGGDFEELDHYPIPVVQGGPHTLENVRPSCAPCNRVGAGIRRAS